MTERFRALLAGSGVEWIEVEGGRSARVTAVLSRMRTSGAALNFSSRGHDVATSRGGDHRQEPALGHHVMGSGSTRFAE